MNHPTPEHRDESADRLAPGFPLPPYSYVPGHFPHPISDPRGHSYRRAEPKLTDFDPQCWAECSEYLFAIDLFNSGFYWEAHESWEAVWHAVGRRGPVADFLKALIKLAAAGVKLREQRADGVRRHATRALELLGHISTLSDGEPARFMGLAVGELTMAAQSISQNADGLVAAASDAPIVARLPMQLYVR